jgi:hypothetical protein
VTPEKNDAVPVTEQKAGADSSGPGTLTAVIAEKTSEPDPPEPETPLVLAPPSTPLNVRVMP